MLIDTSAWVEYLRGTGSATERAVATLLDVGGSFATTDVVMLEVGCGSRHEHLGRDLGLLKSGDYVPVVPGDYQLAIALYRGARQVGRSIRSLNDCVIAAVAARARLAILHRDNDFDVLAAVAGVRAGRTLDELVAPDA